MLPAASAPLCLHTGGSEGLPQVQVHPHAQMLVDAWLGEGLVDESSPGPLRAHHGAKNHRDILHARGWAWHPLDGTMGVPWPRDTGFP